MGQRINWVRPANTAAPAENNGEECKFDDGAIGATIKVALKLVVSRDYRLCIHPNRPKGPVVCKCDGCGPKCSGYKVED